MALAACGAVAQPQSQSHPRPLAGTPLVRVDAPWVRATVPGQTGTGGFMRLTARQATQLVGVSTPVAGVAGLHEMKVEGEVMKMRSIPALDLPAGKTVELKPGGHHLMLMDLKQALTQGGSVPLTLLFRNAAGVRSSLDVTVPVSVRAPAPMDGRRQ